MKHNASSRSSRNRSQARRHSSIALSRHGIALACAALVGTAAWAAPEGATVRSGTVNITTGTNVTTINQSSANALIDWVKFSIDAGYTVNVNQQMGAGSILVNRVTGNEASVINGTLNANGQVFVLNPNGVLIGQNGRVSTGGFVASTRWLSDDDFANGRFVLGGSGAGVVRNEGEITTAPGGYVALVGATVANDGNIMTPGGKTVLAAGERVTLSLAGTSLISYSIDRGSLQALVNNTGAIFADGGQIFLQASGVDALSQAVVNHTGLLQARTVSNVQGRIVLAADVRDGTTVTNGGVVNQGGTLDLVAVTGDAGSAETRAAKVVVDDQAVVNTRAINGRAGEWTIRANNLSVAAAGGTISGTALGNNLTRGHVTLVSTADGSGGAGDLALADSINWSANRLTLQAQNNIYIYADQTATGTAQLQLEHGLASADGAGTDYILQGSRINLPKGVNFFTRQGSAGALLDYVVITELGAQDSANGIDLQGINGNPSGRYVLGVDIDASDTRNWVHIAGEGFLPIGFRTSQNFTGIIDGLGHQVNNLYILSRAGDGPRGFISRLEGQVRHLGFVGGEIISDDPMGSYGTGTIAGLATTRPDGKPNIVRTYAANVRVEDRSGGATGGLLGAAAAHGRPRIAESYFEGEVVGDIAGGILGFGDSAVLSDVYANARIVGRMKAGGLVGSTLGLLSITRGFFTGNVQGPAGSTGGLVGEALNVANVSVIDSYWNRETSGKTTSVGSPDSSGKTTAEMRHMATFAGFQIDKTGGTRNTWRIYEGQTTPLLRAFLKRVTLADTTTTYNGSAQTGAAPGAGQAPTGGTVASGLDAGVYLNTFHSVQQGFDYVGGQLTITPKVLTYTFDPVTKVYDGNTTAPLSTVNLQGLVGPQTLTIGGLSGSFNSPDVLTANTVTIDSISVSDGANGGKASNYIVTAGGTGAGTITPKALGYTVDPFTKVYDGTTAANPTISNITGLVGSETVQTVVTGSLNSAHVPTANTVRIDTVVLSDGTNGGKASNYSMAPGGTGPAQVTPRPLNVTLDVVLDPSGQPVQTTFQDNRLPGDVFTIIPGPMSTVGTPVKEVIAGPIKLEGRDAANYVPQEKVTSTTLTQQLPPVLPFTDPFSLDPVERKVDIRVTPVSNAQVAVLDCLADDFKHRQLCMPQRVQISTQACGVQMAGVVQMGEVRLQCQSAGKSAIDLTRPATVVAADGR